MQEQQRLRSLFRHETLCDLIAWYESYFQTAAGYMISFSSGFDAGYSVKKVRELGLSISLPRFFKHLLSAGIHHASLEEIKRQLRTDAVRDALHDLLEQDDELLGKQLFGDMMEENIASGHFFNTHMEQIVGEAFPIKRELWRNELNQETVRRLVEKLELLDEVTDMTELPLDGFEVHRYAYIHKTQG